MESFAQLLSCFASFVFQGKGNSGVKAATGKADEGASNSSADSEQQIDSFDELNLEEKHGSCWSYINSKLQLLS